MDESDLLFQRHGTSLTSSPSPPPPSSSPPPRTSPTATATAAAAFLFVQEAGRPVQGLRGQGQREALRGGLVRRMQGILQEEHQETGGNVSVGQVSLLLRPPSNHFSDSFRIAQNIFFPAHGTKTAI